MNLIKRVRKLSKPYDYDEIEKKVELIWDELEPKIVKEICKELKLTPKHEDLTLDEVHYATGHLLGFCHIIWRMQKKVLKRDYGINWKSPSDLNPEINFD